MLVPILFGTVGFTLILLLDYPRFKRPSFMAVQIITAGVLFLMAFLRVSITGPYWNIPTSIRVLSGISAGIFLVPLIYSTILEIPLRMKYQGGSRSDGLFTAGTYALSRHPGGIWFTLFFTFAVIAIGTNGLLIIACVWMVQNFALIIIQDRLVFPKLFGTSYVEYSHKTPMLIPNGKSLRECYYTLRFSCESRSNPITCVGAKMKNATRLLKEGKIAELWNEYCGFLDLSVEQFMEIQQNLLTEQLAKLGGCQLGKHFVGDSPPQTIEDFKNRVPFTFYDDYADFLLERSYASLPEKPRIWAHTSGRSGEFAHKWIPYTAEMERLGGKAGLACFILSGAKSRGDVNLSIGDISLYSLAPPPYVSGLLLEGAASEFDFNIQPSPEEAHQMDFQERIQTGFKTALHSGLDYFYGITSILLRISEQFSNPSPDRNTKLSDLGSFRAVLRLLWATLKSRLLGRSLLPKDIWKVKGVLCGGTDTSIFRDKVTKVWGATPLEVYASTEFGITATQVWNYEGMTFFPYTNFWEFLTEEDYHKIREDRNYIPKSRTIDRLEVGEEYVIVGTSFHGGALIRFIVGDLIRIIALSDSQTGINLPQMEFCSRIDDLIDIGGFTRLTEKTIWQAIEETEIPYVDFTAKKEYAGEQAVLNLYIEFKEDSVDIPNVVEKIHTRLVALNDDYRDLENMIGLKPMRVTALAKGTFERYFRERQAAGADLAHLKPAHVNPSADVLANLKRMSDWTI
jgi:protein-S-isoprenylcysteine O-methyltransferase Ste14